MIFLKSLAFITVIVYLLITFMIFISKPGLEFQKKCEDKGGYLARLRGGNICLSKNIVIDTQN